MKSNTRAGWGLALAAVLALWTVAGMPVMVPSVESGFGVLQWKTA